MKLMRLAPLLLVPGLAAASGGTASMDFLNLDAGARPVALGGAYTALAADSNALLYNPAGLGRVKRHEVTLMHNEFVQGLSQDYLGLATVQGFGATLNYARLGDVARTRVDAPDGTLGTLGVSDMALAAGYGRSFLDGALSAGAGFKYLRENAADATAAGYAADLGLLADAPFLPGATVGLALLNAGRSVKYLSEASALPTTARLGAAYAFKALGARHTLAFDVSRQLSDAARFGAGLETLAAGGMALRLGATTRHDAGLGLTGGLGWAWRSLSIDYAFSPYGDLGMANRLSVTFRWGAAERQAAVEPKPLQVAASVEARFERVDEFLKSSRYDEAALELVQIERALEDADARRVRYHERAATLAFIRGEFRAARGHYIEALRRASAVGLSDVVVADSYAGVGFCLIREGQPEYAGRFLRKALDVGPSRAMREAVEVKLRAL